MPLGNPAAPYYACPMQDPTTALVIDDDADVRFAARIALSTVTDRHIGATS